jgi:hypothetical protein
MREDTDRSRIPGWTLEWDNEDFEEDEAWLSSKGRIGSWRGKGTVASPSAHGEDDSIMCYSSFPSLRQQKRKEARKGRLVALASTAITP